jgi:hypothetical protein
MGVNYYIRPIGEKESDANERRIHIGKSSAGWCFALHVHPKLRIFTLQDWESLFDNHEIINDYDVIISKDEMLKIIRDRKFHLERNLDQEFLKINHAIAGPNGLLRSNDDRVLYQGEGTWDCIIGDEDSW